MTTIVLVNIAAAPPQNRLCDRPELTSNGPERQSMTIETYRGTFGGIRRIDLFLCRIQNLQSHRS